MPDMESSQISSTSVESSPVESPISPEPLIQKMQSAELPTSFQFSRRNLLAMFTAVFIFVVILVSMLAKTVADKNSVCRHQVKGLTVYL
jgi:hypothetical protein